MRRTVNDLIKELESLKKLLGDKPIKVVCPNGLLVYPTIKYVKKDPYDNLSEIEEVVLHYKG